MGLYGLCQSWYAIRPEIRLVNCLFCAIASLNFLDDAAT